MEEKREPESFMMRVARFIVNKRKAFIALFILACIYSVLSMSKVKVINVQALPFLGALRQIICLRAPRQGRAWISWMSSLPPLDQRRSW